MLFASSLQFSVNFRSRSAAISLYMENIASAPSAKSDIVRDGESRFWAGSGRYREEPETTKRSLVNAETAAQVE